jgi:hypothetical protein
LIKSKFQIKKELFHVLLFIALIAVVFILNLLPLYFYNAEFGINNEAVIRGAGQSEVLGLKIIQLFLPIKAHGLDIINNKIMFYNASAPLINENTSAYLGLLGSIGCLFLFILLFVHTNNNKLFLMSRLNVAGVLLATIGGFSSIFSYFVSPVLRSYNRMSVFLAFFAILSIVIVINDYIDKDEKPIKTGGLFLFYITFCFFGIFWQYPYSLKNKILDNVSNLENSYNSDAEFISRIESALPKGSMIYQMPFHQFPEGWPLNNMDDYRLFAGVIHSKHLKWSFGAMRGRYPDQWHKALNAMSLDQKLNTLSFVGFEGIYIDRRAYTSSEISELEQSLSEFLGEPALYSNDNNLAFFDMANYNKQIRSSYSDNELANLKHSLLEDIYSLSNYEFRKEIFLQYGENEFKEGFLQGPGWSGPETEGTWTDGNGPAVLQFNLNDKQKMNDLQFTMQVNAMLADSYSILANGLLVSGIISEAGIIDVMIPRDILYLDDILTIAIVLNNPKIPNNSDQRLLGIRVASVSIKNYQIYSNPAVSFKMPSRKGEIAEYLFAKPYAIKSQANDYYVDRSKNIVEWNGKGIIFGPYVDAGKGRYKFVVNYTYLEYKDPCVFDILSNVTTVLTESVLESNDQQLVFEITLNNKVNLEFRVRNPGPSRIRLSSIEVIRL